MACRAFRNKLVKVEHTNNYGDTPPTWSIVVEYYYDGLNRRVKKDRSGNGTPMEKGRKTTSGSRGGSSCTAAPTLTKC